MRMKQNFKRKLIASAIASSAFATLSSGVLAQTNSSQADEDVMLEEVVVTGIRASLERSMDMKRDTSGVVDAISAEDIGKFPDTNLAESLQRITGVSISRENGEGSKVTVRGLGPDFNLVTLNGRQMPGATIGATYASGSRSFDFGNLASEGVQAVEVFKTSRSDVPSGGMGATINIVTPKPLEIDSKASVGVKGVWDESAPDSELTPEISGIYSNSFADGKIGIAVTGSYQERKGGFANATNGGGWTGVPGSVVQDWGGQEGVDWLWGGIDFLGGTHRNQPEDGDVYGVPQQVGYAFGEFERTRTNGQLTLQFAPTDDLTATVDYTYSQNEFSQTYHDLGAWFGWGGQDTIFTDNPSPGVQTPELYSERSGGGDLTMGVGVEKTRAENNSIGLNIEWNPIEPLTLGLDAHSSEAKLGPDSPYGNSSGISVTSYSRDRTTLNTRGEVPALVVDLTNSQGGSDILLQDLQVSGSWFRESHSEHKIKQVQFDGNWEFNDNLNVDFGVAWTEGEFNSGFSDNLRDTWGGLGSPGDVPAEFFTAATVTDHFSGSFGETTQEEMNFLGGSNTQVINQRWEADFYQLRDFASENYRDGNGKASCADGSTWYCSADPDTFQQIIETTNSAFVQANFTTDIGSMAFYANAGLRYEETDVEAPYTGFDYQPLRWVSNNEIYMRPVEGSARTVNAEGSYDFILPSLDLRLDVLENVTVRASYSESIARPDWLQLVGDSYNEQARVDGVDASAGNPGLEPYQSDNIDLSLEWYYGDASYASVGYFRKNVSKFISSINSPVEGPLDNTPNPAAGERAQAAWDSGIARSDSGAVRQYIYDNFADPDTAYMDANGNIIIVGIAGEDPNATVHYNTFFNSDREVTIDGIEANIQHTFGESGFGFIANYTMVDENIGYDLLDLDAAQTPITGLSDTANLVAFYDKNGLQARIAYNWRDSFLAAVAQGGLGNSPLFVDEYSQIDMNVSYDVTDNLTVFVEGLNLTEENGRNYSRSTNQIVGYYEGYARYNIGARYTF
ncbi:TonB-dependent receptor [Gilvimarinus sp. DA14]|uniref:TonB-dependent receptor n=1 Tax=Gilvimarinus sp. DA14 TaxID=2956798 RepID=UPI0020B8B343|nr:TonB-dependent receptor [Gilvimarinus sp. DA14]UTF58665.1 TonB-dependent receptor [Gilvimarinus sp. DA14]